MIPDHVVAEVRARADLVEVVSEHVPLKRAGKEFRGLCPFHQEKTPSFYVVPAKGFYKCFGCGEAGDVFSFLMKRLGLTFHDAVRQLAGRVGVEIPETPRERREDDAHRVVYEALAFATEFFQRHLREEPTGAVARSYLDERGVAAAAVERFLLGYAPADWRALRDAAGQHGFDDAVLLQAGLIKETERSPEPYDRFRDRLIFPITDVSGRVIAFGGRVLGTAGGGAPKYLNSPESPLYHKGSVLYGLAWSRSAIRREQTALVVEGYMDYVSVAAAGLEHVVAPLGTALTDEQARLLSRYTRRVLLLYDSDAAGLRATFRSGDALLRAGVHPLVVSLPEGEDPDSLVRRHGAAGLASALEAAMDVLELKLQILEARGYLRDVGGTRRAVDALRPTILAATDAALRDIYLARVAERTGVRRETLERGWGRGIGGTRNPGPVPADAAPERRRTVREPAERLLILLLLRDPDRVAGVASALDPADLRDPAYRELFGALTSRPPTNGEADAATAAAAAVAGDAPPWVDPERWAALSPAARDALEALRQDPEEIGDGDRVLAELVGDIRARPLFRRLEELDARMQVAKGADAGQLLRERAEVLRSLQGIGSELGRLGFKISPRYRRRLGRTAPDRSEPSPEKG